MTRSIDDAARDAAPLLAELIRKYPPTVSLAKVARLVSPTDEIDDKKQVAS